MFNKLTVLALTVSASSVSSGSIRGQPPTDNTLSTSRGLQVNYDITGECTVANFESGVGDRATLAGILGVNNDVDAIQAALDTKCESARQPDLDLSDAIGKGPQFLKNFLDGGTTWNDNYESGGNYDLSVDADIIPDLHENKARTTVFATPDGGTSANYPRYFSNFFNGEKECRLGVIECCYTASRSPDTNTIPGLVDNAEMCALDLTLAAKSNHIASPDFRPSFTFYGTQDQDDTYCSGFAYDEGSFGDDVKYNTLFHMAMMTNLYEKNYVKNIPGAPLCGCLEQMPVVDNADCVKEREGYKIDSDGNVSINLGWMDCGMDLYSYYESLPRKGTMEKSFVKEKIVGKGNCEAAAISFMNQKMYKLKA